MCGAGRHCDCFGAHRGDQPRGFLRAGSCVTASAAEPRPRSQVYLRRPRWAGVRHAGPEDPGGRGVVPELGGKVLPGTHAFPAGTRRLSSGARLRRCSPIVTTEEPSWERGAGQWEWRPVQVSLSLPGKEALGATPGSGSPRPRSSLVPVGRRVCHPVSGPTCQLPQPHIHVLSWALAAALSMDDHLAGSDIDLSRTSAPHRRWP